MTTPIEILTALAEPTRLAALSLLRDGGEHCICELTRSLGVSQSRMSRHMTRLKRAGLVLDRRDGRWVRYRCAPAIPAPVAALVAAAVDLTHGRAETDGRIAA